MIVFLGLLPALACATTDDRTGVLDNGLSYRIRHTSRPIGVAAFRLLVNAGEVDVTDPALQGAAHLIEHMAFRDTDAFPGGELVPWLRSQGVLFGPDLNGQTRTGFTSFQFSLPVRADTDLLRGLDALHGIAGGIRFREELFKPEQRVVAQEERGVHDNPWSMAWMDNLHLYMRGTGAENWSFGTPDSIRAFRAADVAALYHKLYRPERMTVVVAGDIDTAWCEAQIRQRFADLGQGPVAAWQRPAWPALTETVFSHVSVPDRQGDLINLSLQWPPLPAPGPERDRIGYRYAFLRYALQQSLRISVDWAWRDDGQTMFSLSWPARSLSNWLEADATPDKLFKLPENALQSFARVPMDQATVEQLKKEYLGSVRQWHDTMRDEASSEADILLRTAQGRNPPTDASAEWPAVNAALAGMDGQQLSQLLVPMLARPRYVQLIHEQKYDKVVPTEAQVQAWYRQYRASTLSPALTRYAPVPLPPARYPAAPVASQQQLGDVTEIILANHLRVLVRPMKSPRQTAYFYMMAPGGMDQFPVDAWGGALAASGVINDMPVAGVPHVDLVQTRLAAGVNFEPYVVGDVQGFRGSAPVDQFETVLAEIHHRLTLTPDSSQAGWGRPGNLQNPSVTPDPYKALMEGVVKPAAFNGDYRATEADSRWYSEYKSWMTEAAFKRLFGSPGQFTLVITGAVSAAEIRPLLEKWLSGIPAEPATHPPVVTPWQPVNGGEHIAYRPGASAAADRILFATAQSWSPEHVVHLAVLSQVLSARVYTDLRNATGASYTPYISSDLSGNGLATVQINFDADPEHEAALLAAARQLCQSLTQTPVSGP
ncbi:M16 family metallopeptidase [Silvimonas iriomotensis]|uniref:M16 family metallopeptidase n=1 Tax=Silvimonas iriomotensis TaxID=449662 RepID=UPI001667BC08|nr:insulinase family protein [Silvimonas iriomotensis]